MIKEYTESTTTEADNAVTESTATDAESVTTESTTESVSGEK